ncbi:MAG TPA: G5 domain-containing protein, partial [Limnochordia bacterium]|nr:G5 domain-containing protein [Limnochordia bacterium]
MADESRLNDSAYSYAVATLPATGLAWWRRRLVLAAAATGLIILFCLYLVWRHDVIVVAFDGEPQPVHQLGGTVQSALGAAGVQLLPTDRVVPALGTPLHDGLRIRVVHTFPLTLTDGGKAVQVRSAGESVAALLELLGVTLGPLDEVRPALDHVLQPGDAVQIVRVKRETVTMNASVPYPVKRWADPTLAQGITKVQQAGVPGEALQTFRVTYRDGVESQRELLAAKVTRAPTAEILSVGTSPVVHTLHVGGATYRYSRSLKVLATAY